MFTKMKKLKPQKLLLVFGISFSVYIFIKFGPKKLFELQNQQISTNDMLTRIRKSPCQLLNFNLSFPENPETDVAISLSAHRNSKLCVKRLAPNIPSLTAECRDRLGNQMFSYATLYAIAQYNQRQAHMSPLMSTYISTYFQVSLATLDEITYKNTSWITRNLPAKVQNSIRHLPKKAPNGSPSRIKFCCFPQAWRYFHDLRPQILTEFKFHPEIQFHAVHELARAKQKFYSNLPASAVTFIGVHVRRGDYVREQQLRRCRLPTVEFYKSAMTYIGHKVINPVFVVASDDIGWCQKTFLDRHSSSLSLSDTFRIHFLEGIDKNRSDAGWDMAVLSSCDHVIFGLGTFGFWAGYLNPGEVVYCDDCIPKDSVWMKARAIYGGTYGNFVLPSWKGIHWNGTG